MDRALEGRAWTADAPAQRGWRTAAFCVVLLALAVGGDWIAEHAQLADEILAAALLAYVLAMAVPFVPGIEIGLALMMALGDEGIVLVYAATQAALLLSFALGRWVPARAAGAVFRWLGLARAARLLHSVETLPPAERAAALARQLPGRWGAMLGRHYGFGLALLLNLPGNAVIGGAGGIGMLAGMSRAIPLARYLVLAALATTPVPLLLLLR